MALDVHDKQLVMWTTFQAPASAPYTSAARRSLPAVSARSHTGCRTWHAGLHYQPTRKLKAQGGVGPSARRRPRAGAGAAAWPATFARRGTARAEPWRRGKAEKRA